MIHSEYPMQGKKVLVPRGKQQAKSLSQLIEKEGGIPVEIPLIAFRHVSLDPELRAVLKNLTDYEWIIFTSKVAVETFLAFMEEEQITTLPKIAVIGKKTEQVLRKKQLTPVFLPSEFVAETFVTEFLRVVKKGTKILLPKGNLARDYIAESLRMSGVIVDEAVIYENYFPDDSRDKLKKMIEKDELDLLLFTSSSTVDHFMEVIREHHLESHLKACLIGCIGPVTEKTIKSYGLDVHASPKVYTVEEMINSMVACLEDKNRR